MANADVLTKEKVASLLDEAFEKHLFKPFYQPQYSHSTGALLGAEALARLELPEYGMVSPALFVPVLEEKGLVYKLDLAIFECVCRFLKECKEKNLSLAPISTNISRLDLRRPGFLKELDAIRVKYDLPPNLLPLELTESVAAEGNELISAFLNEVHKIGYKVEMDDFGTGYSSLNVLKDFDFDILKLDMAFLKGDLSNGKGGTIVTMVIHMASWLGIPVIAEGVENVSQADFLRSVGCDHIQGYLYSKPIPESEYKEILGRENICAIVPTMSLIDTLDTKAFWSPESQETLIFNNYVGSAAIFQFNGKKTEILRVNQKFLKEIGMNLSERDLVYNDLFEFLDENAKKEFILTLEKGKDGEEVEIENLWKIKSACCGEEDLYIRSCIRLIGKGDGLYLFYGTFRNITQEKQRFNDLQVSEKRFKMASEQVNIYYWEYTVATKEMRPCFRCMRDLGLPALVKNYPEPAIEMGIFPPEVADMYRDWHKQIGNGVKSLEAVIPLTAGRVPFLVRYTTEFDDAGRPVKAYGSATLIVDNK